MRLLKALGIGFFVTSITVLLIAMVIGIGSILVHYLGVDHGFVALLLLIVFSVTSATVYASLPNIEVKK